MKTSLLCLIIAAFLLFGRESASQSYNYKETHIVGTQPLASVYDLATVIHIICGGRDVDFDGVFDPEDGDVLPSWWHFEGFRFVTSGINPPPDRLVKFRDLDFGDMGFPFRPGIRRGVDEHDSSGILYISQHGRVKSYALKDGELIDDTVVNVAASAVYYADGELFLSIRDTIANIVIVYNIAEDRFTDTITAGVNVQQVEKFSFFEQQYLAVLNEGYFNSETSTLQIFEISDGNYLLDTTIAIGKAGNHIAVKGDLMAVTVNGSHQVVLIDIPDFTINKTIPIPAVGEFDGPRESAFTIDGIYTTSYEGKAFLLNPSTGEITGDLESDGKAEAILGVRGVLIITNPFVTGGYAPDSTITVWSMPTGVEPANVIRQLTIYPNPVTEVIFLKADFENLAGTDFQFQISDINGRILYQQNFIADGDGEGHEIQFDISDIAMPAGSYYAIVKNNKYLRAIPFVKIK